MIRFRNMTTQNKINIIVGWFLIVIVVVVIILAYSRAAHSQTSCLTGTVKEQCACHGWPYDKKKDACE